MGYKTPALPAGRMTGGKDIEVKIISDEALKRVTDEACKRPIYEKNVTGHIENAVYFLSGYLKGGEDPCSITGDQLHNYLRSVMAAHDVDE